MGITRVLKCVHLFTNTLKAYDYESDQQDATIQLNLLFLVGSTCFGQCFRTSSEANDCI
jgi:hypothetical protein